ncbi:MAG: hypothetical protein WC755_07510 [Candidatus Woesearchaeota archaeon]|jgi:NAD-dependent SIR2 family protein deacetylase
MAENVFILGAGASAESGAPLMNDFLDVSEDLLFTGQLKDCDDLKSVFTLLADLQNVYAKSYLDLNNIESLFGTIEMARIINKLGDYNAQEIINLKNSLIKLIVKTLEKTIKYEIKDNTICASDSYNKFVDLLLKVSKNKPNISSIITFNYDIAVDTALYRNGFNIDYCLDEPVTGNINLLKLHGSLNWCKCKTCNKIIPYHIKDHFKHSTYNFSRYRTMHNSTNFSLSDKFNDLVKLKLHEHDNFEEVPVIVPPTWNKTEYQGTLTNVWHVAAAELSNAKNIYVIGYSLPESDLFFRYLFSLGTIGKERIRRFWVYNPDDSGKTKARYEGILGRGIINRFTYNTLKFSEAIQHIEKNIQ